MAYNKMFSWYKFVTSILKIYVSLFVDEIRIYGEELIPDGPKIIVANHPNATDAFILPIIFPETLHFLIQGSVFSTPFIGGLLTWAEQIPVIKEQGYLSLELAKEKLNLGNSVVIFPEGRLNNDQGLHKGRSGAARLGLETGVPILPVGFYVPPDALRSFSRNIRDENRVSTSRWQWGGDCFIRVGRPFNLSMDVQSHDPENQLINLTEMIMKQIAALIELAKLDALPGN